MQTTKPGLEGELKTERGGWSIFEADFAAMDIK